MTSVSKTRAPVAKKRASVAKAKPAVAKTKPTTTASVKRMSPPTKSTAKATVKTPVKGVAKKATVTKVAPVKKAAPTKVSASKTNHKKPSSPVIQEKNVVTVMPSPALPPVVRLLEIEDDLIGEVGHDMGPLPNDEVFDETDGAQHLQLREQADIQRRARLMNQPETHPEFDGTHCVDCDTEIPAARLAMHRVRCVHCQQDLENMSRQQQARGR